MYKAIADQLKDVVLRIGAKTGTSGAIFGSITNVQIANALKEQCNLDIERKKIVIEDEVKTVGEYTAKINLHKELQASVRFEVTEE